MAVVHLEETAARMRQSGASDDEIYRMRAAAFDRFGAPEVIRPTELPVPRAGAGQVVVRVAAATVKGRSSPSTSQGVVRHLALSTVAGRASWHHSVL